MHPELVTLGERAIEGRRLWLLRAAAIGASSAAGTAGMTASGAAPPVALAATWEVGGDGPAGRFAAGLLGRRAAGALGPESSFALPGRAHGVAVERDGRLLVVARRPGDWLVRFDPAGRQRPQWFWSEGDTVFNGHVLASRDGRRVFTTETDRESGEGLIGVRDAATLEPIEHWTVGGLDPHELLEGPDGALWVAVGGIEVRPETGRLKHDLASMDSSLLRLDPADGRETGRWRLADRRLGLRHLALDRDGRIGIALQAEHDDPAVRDRAPVLAIWDAAGGLRAIPLPEAAAFGEPRGYGGSIAATGDGFVVSCPRADRALCYRPGGDGAAGGWLEPIRVAEVCPLAVTGGGGRELWVGGFGEARHLRDAGLPRESRPPRGVADRPRPPLDEALAVDRTLRLDNHWVAYRG